MLTLIFYTEYHGFQGFPVLYSLIFQGDISSKYGAIAYPDQLILPLSTKRNFSARP